MGANEDLQAHYAQGVERDRLAGGASRLEFARTKELLERHLPSPPARILDVGGGPGAYARWLVSIGYSVHLIDPVPLHVEQANSLASSMSGAMTVQLGDARHLDVDDATFDTVLMLGPIYHLTERADRVAALVQARRVVRGDGPIAIAMISRFVSLLDGLANRYLGDPAFEAIVEQDLRDGQHRNPTDRPEYFTTAFFHHPDDVEPELADAGLQLDALYGVEGPAWLLPELLEDEPGWEDALRAARALETEARLLWMSGHVLAIARPGSVRYTARS
jgi:ubiquinone/menaquinone biosynthesis C-methylase UbiE